MGKRTTWSTTINFSDGNPATQDGPIQASKKLVNSHVKTWREVLKLATLGETVYVGKRDGQLYQSLDGGDSWNDITSNLPQSVEHFNQIVFADSTVHVATDKGVFSSKDGVNWNVLTDKTGESIIIKSLASTEDSVFGANDEGIYHLYQINLIRSFPIKSALRGTGTSRYKSG